MWINKKRSVACAAILSSSLAVGVPAFAASPECAGLMPPTQGDLSGLKRGVTAEDLARLRDIGPEHPLTSPVAASPDGKSVALPLMQGDPDSNSYCLGVLVISRQGGPPILVDKGGELIRDEIATVDGLTMESGIPKVIVPQWSKNGRWLAFLKRVNGRTQVWKAASDGSSSAPLTDSPLDVDRFALLDDGRTLVFATRPAFVAGKQAIEQEGLGGFHFDDRYLPHADSRPQLPPGIPSEFQSMDLLDRTTRPATDVERRKIELPPEYFAKTSGQEPPADGKEASWVEATDATFATPGTTVKYRDATGRIFHCIDPRCIDARPPAWVSGHGGRVVFLRREGWAKSLTSVYEWVPRRAKVRRVLQTEDQLSSCLMAAADLLCLREAWTQPSELVRIDLNRRKIITMFDPNPEWRKFRFSKVERIKVRNDIGLETAVDFVFPTNYRPGQKFPAVVVQYVSRGFLRGGVGDEYPIWALAANGYGVLSVNRPPHLGILRGAKTLVEVEQVNLEDWGNRKSILSSIEIPLRGLIKRGIIDDKRVGITGFSDGTTTIQFAALHSSLFSAAAMSSCCWERSQDFLLGPRLANTFAEIGYPTVLDSSPNFWRDISLAQNTDQVRMPILMQVADREYVASLEAYTALKRAGRPIDLFVFPDEYHNKWQPAHRLAIYRRSIDWFNFWFKHEVPLEGRRKMEAMHWLELRENAEKADRTSGGVMPAE